jgi:hypothetical protein
MKAQKVGDGKAAKPPSREGKKMFAVFLDLDTLKTLQHLAIDREMTMQALGEEAVALLLKRYKPK